MTTTIKKIVEAYPNTADVFESHGMMDCDIIIIENKDVYRNVGFFLPQKGEKLLTIK